MLFQPTNILPDIISGTGQGTVDTEGDGLTVSWQINGNSKMTAYWIKIYKNDAASTLMYSTGKVNYLEDTNLPASGVDSKGNIQRFTAITIDPQELLENDVANGYEYKLQIIQYYMESGVEKSISQKSMSVFVARATPSLSITNPSGTTVSTNDYTFTGSYSQQQGDPLEWVRWRLYKYEYGQDGLVASWDLDSMTCLEDTGKMYGVLDLEFNYNGLLNTSNYVIVLNVMTENGIEAEARKAFATAWSVVTDTQLYATACLVDPQSSGVDVKWGGFHNIYGEATGDYAIVNRTLVLPQGSSIEWNNENGVPLSIAEPWAVIGKVKLNKDDATDLLKIIWQDSNSHDIELSVSYEKSTRKLYTTIDGSTSTIPSFAYDSAIWFFIEYGSSEWKCRFLSGGLTPSQDLTPGTGVSPSEGTKIEELNIHDEHSWIVAQGAIRSITVSGNLDVYYLQVIQNYTTAQKNEIINIGFDYQPQDYTIAPTVFLADFDDGTLNAGSFSLGNEPLKGWAIYRERKQDETSAHILDTLTEQTEFYDFGCAQNVSTYRYAIYPIGTTKYLTQGIFTEWFTPCSNYWSIIEAEETESGYLKVVNEFTFGKNLSSGAISNNNSPSVSPNFTRYPTVQLSSLNYQSGTLTSLIGHIGYIAYMVQKGDTIEDIAERFHTTPEKIISDNDRIKYADDIKPGLVIDVWFEDGSLPYRDDKKLRDDIWNLSTTKNRLFLKTRKGDLMEIRISGEISFTAMDASPILPLTVSIPWVQIDDATDTSLIGAL